MNNLLNIKEETLSNGLEVIIVQKQSQLMSVNFGVRIGSIYENEQEKGLSHFIEHMLFKGTIKRDNETLMSDIEELGGDFEAFTDNISTVFSISALSEELENSIELLSDMIINPNFHKKQLEKERGVILSEIKSSYDDIEDYSFRKVNELAFEGNNLMYDVLGTEKSVKNFKREDILKFHKKFYIPENSCMVIVSPFDHMVVLDLVKKYFGKWEKVSLNKPNFESVLNKPVVNKVYNKDSEQSTIVYLYTFKGLSRKEEMALDVLNYKLGDNSNSILFKELRENKGLCYDVNSSVSEIEDLKLLYIYTSVSACDVDEAIITIDECINNILNKTISLDDNVFKLIKKVYKTDLASTFEACDGIGDFILQYVLRKEDIFKTMEDIKNLEQMKVEEIYSVAAKVLSNPTVSILIGKE